MSFNIDERIDNLYLSMDDLFSGTFELAIRQLLRDYTKEIVPRKMVEAAHNPTVSIAWSAEGYNDAITTIEANAKRLLEGEK